MLSDDLPWMIKVSSLMESAPLTTSAAFTLMMGMTGRWPTEQVQRALLIFLVLGQTVLPISMDTMKAVLEQEDLRFGHMTRRLIRNATHPTLEHEFAAAQLTRLIRMAVVLAPLPLTRDRWIRQALDVAAEERDALALAQAVLDRLPDAFHLLTHLLPEVTETVQVWLNFKLHPQQLVLESIR
ncbi:hypothetical protein [Deinococcus multiflagellatus]|uniref:Uncharacterized protein n=2 Tax=Deinococcus multiflagellatus TaxID=1656887 RepID=A0ABW1ZTV2_9DEIO